jgi:hypothetical protein
MTTQIGQLPPGRGLDSVANIPAVVDAPGVAENPREIIIQAPGAPQAVRSGPYKLTPEDLAAMNRQSAPVVLSATVVQAAAPVAEYPKVTQIEGTREFTVQASADSQPARSGPYKLNDEERKAFSFDADVRQPILD